MVEKLDLPFPLLSDPDRSLAIGPFDVVDESDPRDLARPAMIIVDPDGNEHQLCAEWVEREGAWWGNLVLRGPAGMFVAHTQKAIKPTTAKREER